MRKTGLISKYMPFVIVISVLLPFSIPVSAVDIPDLDGYIWDEVGVLVYSEYYLDTYGVCEIVDMETSCEIGIVVINSTEGMEISQYAIEVFNSNGIGNRERNNGVLIVVATGDQTYFVAVGSGLESILNDAKVGRFARDYFVPNAEVGDYGYAIFALTVMIGSEIADQYEYSTPHEYPIEGIPLEWPELIIAVSVLVGFFIISKGRYFLWIGRYLWKFSGGRTGGGGAGGRF